MWVEASSINNIFKQFNRLQVIVIGDSMVDTYLQGKVERMSPETGVPVVSVVNRENRLGGAGNVALNIKMLGAEPFLLTVAGDDEKGNILRSLLKENGISDEGVFTDKARPTTVKYRVADRHNQMIRIDEEATFEINAGLEKQILLKFEDLLIQRKPDVIIFSDYDKGMITADLFRKVNELALKSEIKVVADPKKRNFSIYENIHLLKPNFDEFTEGVGADFGKHDFDKIERNVMKLITERNIGSVLLTLSECGIFIHDGCDGQHFPATETQICDVTGAGDTVISMVSLAIAAGADVGLAAELANFAGGLVCRENGVAAVNPDQLLSEFLNIKSKAKEFNYQFDRN
jgi:rfaE bifunctional protein kinase chain/domain